MIHKGIYHGAFPGRKEAGWNSVIEISKRNDHNFGLVMG